MTLFFLRFQDILTFDGIQKWQPCFYALPSEGVSNRGDQNAAPLCSVGRHTVSSLMFIQDLWHGAVMVALNFPLLPLGT